MKLLLIIFFSLLAGLVNGQVQNNTDAALNYKTSTEQKRSIDSFTFGSKTYKVPRKCNTKNQSNCCSYNSNPNQLGCYNGTTLTWDYMVSEKSAADNVKSLPAQLERQAEKFKKEPIVCYLLDKEVSGYKVSYTTKGGAKAYVIIVSGEVDNKAVLVQLQSEKSLKKNKDIQPGIRQILKLKE